MKRLPRSFFQREALLCARELIGCRLVWGACRGVIVETEAYAQFGDPAAHMATRPSTRAFLREHPAGTAYVYMNYGVHWLLNVLTKHPAGHGIILIRALQPLAGLPLMRQRRAATLRRTPPPEHDRWLCSGPGRLAAALGVTGADHGRDLCTRSGPGFLGPAGDPCPLEATPRIGISAATDFPWRFILRGSPYLSR